MENEIKTQEATAAAAPAETPPQAETPAQVQGMKKINIEKFSPRMLMELDACTRCGECSNWCPAYDQDSREPLTPRGRARLFKDIISRQHGAFSADSFLGKLCGKKPVTEEELKALRQRPVCLQHLHAVPLRLPGGHRHGRALGAHPRDHR